MAFGKLPFPPKGHGANPADGSQAPRRPGITWDREIVWTFTIEESGSVHSIRSVQGADLAPWQGCELKERVSLCRVLLHCSLTTTLDELLATLPDAKALSNLARVHQRYWSENG